MEPKHYRLIEAFTQSKTGKEEHNEDRIFLGAHYAAVADGATRTTGSTGPGKTGGQFCVDAIAVALEKLSPDATAEEAAALICREIRTTEQTHNLKEQGIHCCAVAAIYSCSRREVWLIGDCNASVDGCVTSGAKRIDRVFGEVRAIMIHALLSAGYTEAQLLEDDESRKLILPLIDHQRPLENAGGAYGYAVLNGTRLPDSIRVIPVEPGAEVILTTDGYPEVLPTLAQSEETLFRMIRQDPLCYKTLQSTKGISRGCVSFDDRSYLRFQTCL